MSKNAPETSKNQGRNNPTGGNEEAANSKEDPIKDVIVKCVGATGKWQFLICFVVYLSKFAVAWHQLNIVFLAPNIEFQCANATIEKCSPECTEHVFDNSEFTNTITNQWNLICRRKHLESLAQTIAMLGILIGSILFGYLSDIFGRRNALIGAIALQGITCIGEAFSPWLSLFFIMRFLTSTATGGTMVTGFVLIMEVLGMKWRTFVGVYYQIPFSFGHMIMPLLSYWLRDWRYFLLVQSIPSIVLIGFFWFLPESPRWQLAVGKKSAAIKTLKKGAEINKLPTDNIEKEINIFFENKHVDEKKTHKGNILDLLRTRVMRTYTIVLWLNWIIVSFSFYGISQLMGKFGGNIFINVSLPGAVSIPGIVLTYWGLEYWGHKKTLILTNSLAGVLLIVAGFLPSDPTWIKTVLASISMSSVMSSFTTIYIYAGEVFPTVVRNIGVGSSSMLGRVGSMIAPFVANLDTHHWVLPVLFGGVTLLSGLLCFFLPETLHCELPESVEEVEELTAHKR